jgi:hypothetical protein
MVRIVDARGAVGETLAVCGVSTVALARAASAFG